MDSDTPSPSLFASLADLTGYTRTLAIARPEDIVREEDGGSRFGVREGAATTPVEIRALTDAEREKCERLMSAVVPPPVFKDEFGPDGKLRSRVPAGYDEDAPEYLAKRAAARQVQIAQIALLGCAALRESTPGASLDEKTAALRQKVDGNLLEFIAGSIWNLGYTGADAAHFFSTAASEPSRP